MPRNNNFYNQANHSVVIESVDGLFPRRVIGDFYEGDDVISAEPIGDRVALIQGFDRGIVNFSSYKGGQVGIKLKPTSADEGFLNQLFNRQSTNPALINVYIEDGVGEVTRLQNGGLNKEAFQTGGPTAQVKGWLIVGTTITFDETERD